MTSRSIMYEFRAGYWLVIGPFENSTLNSRGR